MMLFLHLDAGRNPHKGSGKTLDQAANPFYSFGPVCRLEELGDGCEDG